MVGQPRVILFARQYASLLGDAVVVVVVVVK